MSFAAALGIAGNSRGNHPTSRNGSVGERQVVWPHTGLVELKVAECFTEIIQHRTRLFVPVGSAPTVIERIAT